MLSEFEDFNIRMIARVSGWQDMHIWRQKLWWPVRIRWQNINRGVGSIIGRGWRKWLDRWADAVWEGKTGAFNSDGGTWEVCGGVWGLFGSADDCRTDDNLFLDVFCRRLNHSSMVTLIRASTATLKLVAISSVWFPSLVTFFRVSRVCSLFRFDTILKGERTHINLRGNQSTGRKTMIVSYYFLMNDNVGTMENK